MFTDRDKQQLTVSPARGPSQLHWGHMSARTVGRELCCAAHAHVLELSKVGRGPALLTADVATADFKGHDRL